MSRIAIFRLAAFFLLLMTAGELVSCEICNPLGCSDFAASPSDNTGAPDDSCICCCRHIVVGHPAPIFVAFDVVTGVTPLDAPKPEITSFPIYHPPKA